MRILIVDDDPDVLEFLEAFFTNLGHETIRTDNAKQGLRELVVKQPDLVLMDIMIGDEDGIALLKEMKDIDKEAQIVMITAFKDAERVIEAFRLGALDCLLKPFNIDYIINNVLPKIELRRR
jgi:two-component system response regulator AtoC